MTGKIRFYWGTRNKKTLFIRSGVFPLAILEENKNKGPLF